MRFTFIHAEKANHAVRMLCRVLLVSPSGYYAWRKREPSGHARRDAVLAVHARAIYKRSRGTYGSPRVHAELKKEGWAVGPPSGEPRSLLRPDREHVAAICAQGTAARKDAAGRSIGLP